jgi:hypothetical protein
MARYIKSIWRRIRNFAILERSPFDIGPGRRHAPHVPRFESAADAFRHDCEKLAGDMRRAALEVYANG